MTAWPCPVPDPPVYAQLTSKVYLYCRYNKASCSRFFPFCQSAGPFQPKLLLLKEGRDLPVSPGGHDVFLGIALPIPLSLGLGAE